MASKRNPSTVTPALLKTLGISRHAWEFNDLDRVGHGRGGFVDETKTCCGARELTSINTLCDDTVAEVIATARRQGASFIIYYSVDRHAEKQLEKFGFHRTAQFRNRNTGNEVHVMTLVV